MTSDWNVARSLLDMAKKDPQMQCQKQSVVDVIQGTWIYGVHDHPFARSM